MSEDLEARRAKLVAYLQAFSPALQERITNALLRHATATLELEKADADLEVILAEIEADSVLGQMGR